MITHSKKLGLVVFLLAACNQTRVQEEAAGESLAAANDGAAMMMWTQDEPQQQAAPTAGRGPSPAQEPAPLTAVAAISGGGNSEWNDRAGHAVAIGDFDGDGRSDVAIGAPGETLNGAQSSGHVKLLRGASGGATMWSTLSQSGLGADESFDHFGWALAAGNFDGDQFDDLAVGAPGEAPGASPASGAVFVFRGSANGLVSWQVLDQASLGLGNNERGDRFGHALTAGDFDGDGKDDLAIGAPGEAPGGAVKSGAVFVARGTASGLAGQQTLSQSQLGSAEKYERFGSSLASGNLIGSKITPRDELVVGCYDDRIGSRDVGAVYVYLGTSSGPSAHSVVQQFGLQEHGDQFGRALAVGDFNGDGWDDLAAGAPGENHHDGAIFIFRGGSLAVTDRNVLTLSDFGLEGDGDRLGWALAAADVNGDGKDDLVAGAPRGRSSAMPGAPRSGRAHVYLGSDADLAPSTTLTQAFVGTNEEGDGFGSALAAGDLQGDGRADLVVGAPTEHLAEPRAGAVYGFRGTAGVAEGWFRYSQTP